jgi:hypothetical protein
MTPFQVGGQMPDVKWLEIPNEMGMRRWHCPCVILPSEVSS